SYLFFVFMSAVAAEIYTLSLPDALPIFAVEIVLDALIAAFLAEAGLLESAEGRLRRGDQPFIDADQAIFEPLHHAEGAAEIAGVEIGGQPVNGVVGATDPLLLGLGTIDRRDRSEDLLLGETHVAVRIRDHRRLEEGAAERMTCAAGDDPAALGPGVRDQFLDLGHGILVDERPLPRILLEARSDLELLSRPRQLLDEFVIDAG